MDVIVNSTNSDLNLQIGQISQELLGEGGEGLQEECRHTYPNGISAGEIAVTSGGRLPCQAVFHVTVMKIDSQRADQKEQAHLARTLFIHKYI